MLLEIVTQWDKIDASYHRVPGFESNNGLPFDNSHGIITAAKATLAAQTECGCS